jgi:hypothetical protein
MNKQVKNKKGASMHVPKKLKFQAGKKYGGDCAKAIKLLLKRVPTLLVLNDGYVYSTRFNMPQNFEMPSNHVFCGCDCIDNCPLLNNDRWYTITIHQNEIWVLP